MLKRELRIFMEMLNVVMLCYATLLQSCLTLCNTVWTAAHQTPLSTGFSRQEYWSGLRCSPPGDLPDKGIEPSSLMSPALAGGFVLFCFTTSTTWEILDNLKNQGALGTLVVCWWQIFSEVSYYYSN